jgi:hypothetical protein
MFLITTDSCLCILNIINKKTMAHNTFQNPKNKDKDVFCESLKHGTKVVYNKSMTTSFAVHIHWWESYQIHTLQVCS